MFFGNIPLASVPERLGDAGKLAAGDNGDEGMPDGVLIFQAAPFVEQPAGRIEHPADDERAGFNQTASVRNDIVRWMTLPSDA